MSASGNVEGAAEVSKRIRADFLEEGALLLRFTGLRGLSVVAWRAEVSAEGGGRVSGPPTFPREWMWLWAALRG